MWASLLRVSLWQTAVLPLAVCYVLTTSIMPDTTEVTDTVRNYTETMKRCASLSNSLLTNVVILPANQTTFALGDEVTFTCDPSLYDSESYVLLGQSSASCTNSGQWNISDMPHCTASCYPWVSSALNGSTAACHHAGCSAVYRCPISHLLLTITCSTAGLWLPDPLPACNDHAVEHHSVNWSTTRVEHIASPNTGDWSEEEEEEGRDSLDDWQLAFTSNTQWTGSLSEGDSTYDVTFRTLSLPDDDSMNATLLIDSRITILITVTGNNSVTVFHPISPSSTSPQSLSPDSLQLASNWTLVLGTLEHHKSDDTWVYMGRIVTASPVTDTSSHCTLFLKPHIYKPLPRTYKPLSAPEPSVGSSSTSLLLGVSIALMAILVAAGLATYCVRHKLDVACTIPRSFSSFENPVYDLDATAAINRICSSSTYDFQA